MTPTPSTLLPHILSAHSAYAGDTPEETPAQRAAIDRQNATMRLARAQSDYEAANLHFGYVSAISEPFVPIADRDRHRVKLEQARNGFAAASHELRCAQAQCDKVFGKENCNVNKNDNDK